MAPSILKFIIKIENQLITGVQANIALKEVREQFPKATAEDLDAAFVEVSGHDYASEARRGGVVRRAGSGVALGKDGRAEVAVKRIIDDAAKACCRALDDARQGEQPDTAKVQTVAREVHEKAEAEEAERAAAKTQPSAPDDPNVPF
jgi:hypothetical protein